MFFRLLIVWLWMAWSACEPAWGKLPTCSQRIEKSIFSQLLISRYPFAYSQVPYLSAIWPATTKECVVVLPPLEHPSGFAQLPTWQGFDRRDQGWGPPIREVVLVYNRKERRAVVEVSLFGEPFRPGGSVEEDARPFLAREKPTALSLSEEGRRVFSALEVPDQRNAEGGFLMEIQVPIRLHNDDGSFSALVVPEYRQVSVEFKKAEGGTSETLKRLVTASLKSGGQSPWLVIDARDTNLTEEESERAAKRLIGHLQEHWDRDYPARLQELRVMGPGFDHLYVFLTEEIFQDRLQNQPEDLHQVYGVFPLLLPR